jgi:hypothetical protein
VLLVGHGEPKPRCRRAVVILAQDGNKLLNLAAELGHVTEHGGMFLLRAGEDVYLGRQGPEVAAQGADVHGEGCDRRRSVIAALRHLCHWRSSGLAGGSQGRRGRPGGRSLADGGGSGGASFAAR